MECLQLGRGKRVGELDCLDLGSQKVVRERQVAAVQKLGVTPADLCTVSCCTPAPGFRFSEHCAGAADTIFFMPEKTEFDLHVPAGAETAYVCFSQSAFLSGARALNPAGWDHPPSALKPFRTSQSAAFRSAVDLWFRSTNAAAARGDALDVELLRRILFQTVLQIVTAPPGGDDLLRPLPMARARALRIARSARAYMEDRLEADVLPTIVDLCGSIGVSERTLQYAFREYVGLAPTAYLRLCRLNRVRATLLAADRQETTVTEVAMRFGFLHLGRFAGDYQRVFDETPSATLVS